VVRNTNELISKTSELRKRDMTDVWPWRLDPGRLMRQTLVGGKPVDATLDIEQRVNALDRLQRQRRDRGRAFAAAGVRADIDKFEELPSRMGPTQGGDDRPREGS